MNEAHIHLIVNHFPIIVPIIGMLVMLGGILLKSEVVKRTAFAIFFLGALITVPAYFSGEGAEEIVEHYGGVNHRLIHQHGDVASTFAILSYLLGLLSAVGFWASWKKKGFANIITYVTVVFAAVVLYFAQETGNSGGKIRHPEIIESGGVPAGDYDEDND
jgi:uncharacterized membrane protein